jgi:peptide deformylase
VNWPDIRLSDHYLIRDETRMALLTILEYPDPRLRTKARPVTAFDAALRQRIEDMFETMYAAPGIGLAASQIDWHHQLIVMDLGAGLGGQRSAEHP